MEINAHGLNIDCDGPCLKDNAIQDLGLEREKIIDSDQNMEELEFFIPNIKLVGYGRTQSYQICCLRCEVLEFNFNDKKILQDLFCSECESDEKYLSAENRSKYNYFGNIVGWEVKSNNPSTKRSYYNYKKVYVRDGWTCQYCGYNMRNAKEFRPLHIDHILPFSACGSNKMNNLCVSCGDCNLIALDKWFRSFNEKKEYIEFERFKKDLYSRRKRGVI